MAHRNRKEEKRYKHYRKNVKPKEVCDFCDMDESFPQFIRETKSFKLFRNIFPYTSWDMTTVQDHLLLSPKRHVDKLGDLTSSEAIEFIDIVGSFERDGYSLLARGPSNAIKSVPHQHTHFIKTGNKAHKFILYTKRPYIQLNR